MTLRGHRTLPLWSALLAGASLLAVARPRAFPATSPSEYAVKAAYLYNFGRFIEWPHDVPAGQSSDFAICVLGNDPFGAALDSTISGEKIDGKSVVARRIAQASEASGCRVVFISASENRRLKELLPAVSKLGVLTVSDLPQFLQEGGMVQFVLVDARVRFAINLPAALQSHLNLSSELLKVAVEVKR